MANSPNKELTERDLLQIDLPQERYGADMKLFEDGRQLSSELLKLSLAGVAVVSVLLPLLPKPAISPASPGATDGIFKLLLSGSVIAFAISAGLALLQRFYASSGMFHHIKAMKIAVPGDPTLNDAIEIELRTRFAKFIRAHSFLKTTAVGISVGAALLAGAFIRLMCIL